MKSIYNEVLEMVSKERTKIGKEATEVLQSESICGIVKKDNVFWFESYTTGNNCNEKIHKYLINIIKRKMNLNYLYEVVTR